MIQKEKQMLILRYGYILFFVTMFSIDYKSDYYLGILLLLLYLINNQLRYFILPKKNSITIISVFLEIFICYLLYKSAGNFGTVVFIPVLIDILYEFGNLSAGVYLIGINVLVISQQNLNLIITLFLTSLPIFLLLTRVKDEEIKKLGAQDLYDRLRQKDEELKKVNKELETYASTIEEIAVLRERNRISREIHDSVGHALATIRIQLGAIEEVSKVNGEEASKMASYLSEFAKESMERVRGAVRELKPREFEEFEGVIAISEMIKNFQKLTGVEINLRVSDKLWRMNSDQTMVVYRIIQEFLSNSVRHGKATEIKVFLNFLETSLRVHLKDNGDGCGKVIPGVGLKSIKERVATWGGDVEYFTKEGKGFELVVSLDKGKLSVDEV